MLSFKISRTLLYIQTYRCFFVSHFIEKKLPNLSRTRHQRTSRVFPIRRWTSYLPEALEPVYEVNESPGSACCNGCPCWVPVVPVRRARVLYRSWCRSDEYAVATQRSRSPRVVCSAQVNIQKKKYNNNIILTQYNFFVPFPIESEFLIPSPTITLLP